MTGWPAFHLAVALAVVAALAGAGALLLRAGNSAPPAARPDAGAQAATAGEPVAVAFHVRATDGLARFALSHHGRVIHAANPAAQSEFWFDAALPLEQPLELAVTAAWNSGTSNAVWIEAAPHALATKSITIWGGRRAEDVASFDWSGP